MNTNMDVIEFTEVAGATVKIRRLVETVEDKGMRVSLECIRRDLAFAIIVAEDIKAGKVRIGVKLEDYDIEGDNGKKIVCWDVQHICVDALFVTFNNFVESVIIPAMKHGLYRLSEEENRNASFSKRNREVFERFSNDYNSEIKKAKDKKFISPADCTEEDYSSESDDDFLF